MKKFTAVIGALGLGLAVQANAATYTANVTFTIGDVSSDGAAPGTGGTFSSTYFCLAGTCSTGNFDSTGDKGWTSNGPNTIDLSTASLRSNIYGQTGSNGVSYYNPYSQLADGKEDYSAVGQANCLTATFVFDFSCSQPNGKSTFISPTVVKGVGPAATASGTVTIDPVAGTMTGTLTASPFVYRSADGSPFAAAATKVSPAATYVLNLTGTFSSTSWNITGGTATFSDPGSVNSPAIAGTDLYGCFSGDLTGTLCTVSTTYGLHKADDAELSWVDVPVYDKPHEPGGIADPTASLLFTVPGVVATASFGANGVITASSGEFHRGIGLASGGCAHDTAWSAGTLSMICGSVIAGSFAISGTIADSDGDGINDAADNCRSLSNANQRDTNGDGYGNLCDPDLNNDGTVNINDFNRLKARLGIVPVVDVDADLDGNAAVNINDLNRLKSFLGKPPGPSGLHPNCPPTCP